MTEPGEVSSLRFPDSAPQRLDQFLAASQPDHSRARWKQLIETDQVKINGAVVRKANTKLKPDDEISWIVPPPTPSRLVPEEMALDVMFEDEDLLVLNKPPDLVVHPAAGNWTGTLVHGLLHHCEDLAGIGGEERPGIVHRLDRDTSGCLVVAKTEQSLNALAAQFKGREVKKEYVALAWGKFDQPRGTVRTLITRDPRRRQQMCVSTTEGKEAVTHFEVTEFLGDASLLRIRIETGRTHQIRVHLAHLKHPIVGDSIYGRGHIHPLKELMKRQMLHAERLSFRHPRTNALMEFAAPLPPDFVALLEAFRAALPKTGK